MSELVSIKIAPTEALTYSKQLYYKSIPEIKYFSLKQKGTYLRLDSIINHENSSANDQILANFRVNKSHRAVVWHQVHVYYDVNSLFCLLRCYFDAQFRKRAKENENSSSSMLL